STARLTAAEISETEYSGTFMPSEGSSIRLICHALRWSPATLAQTRLRPQPRRGDRMDLQPGQGGCPATRAAVGEPCRRAETGRLAREIPPGRLGREGSAELPASPSSPHLFSIAGPVVPAEDGMSG